MLYVAFVFWIHNCCLKARTGSHLEYSLNSPCHQAGSHLEYMLVVAQLAFNEFKQDLDIDIVYTVVCAQDVDNPRFL